MKIVVLVLLWSSLLFSGVLSKDKHYGVSLNPVSILSAGLMVSGDASYFMHDSATEITVPFFYYDADDAKQKEDNSFSKTSKQMNIDVHYRKYFSGEIGGFFYGAFGRYTYLDGKLKDEFMSAKVSKVGLAAEVGYRTFGIMGYKQLYWGASLALGAYLDDRHDQFEEPMMGDGIPLVDIEFFKFGLVF
jgi:hypothetical protein